VRSGKAPPARAHLRDQAAGPLGAVAPIRLQLMSAGQPSSLYRGRAKTSALAVCDQSSSTEDLPGFIRSLVVSWPSCGQECTTSAGNFSTQRAIICPSGVPSGCVRGLDSSRSAARSQAPALKACSTASVMLPCCSYQQLARRCSAQTFSPPICSKSAAQSLGKERVVAIPLAQAAKVEVGLINCPMLCLAGERDLPECIRQMHTCYEQLHVHKKAQHLLTVAEGADAHCQINNPHLMHQVVIDWLDDVFAR